MVKCYHKIKALCCAGLTVLTIFSILVLVRKKTSSLTRMWPGFRRRDPAVIGVEPVLSEANRTYRLLVNNSLAINCLHRYQSLFASNDTSPAPDADPDKPKTIQTWWQAAAMIDWYINTPLRYLCYDRIPMGNWHICQDLPYTVKPPCLVYSFGINFDFSFDDDMAKLGCEVHSFDPSMKMADHRRGKKSYFHNLGLSHLNSDKYLARLDFYVNETQIWKMRNVKAIMQELGHEHSVIDVFKMDIEGYEWAVLENMMETGFFNHIRQFMLEFHLFPSFPPKKDYTALYKTFTRLREMGFKEFSINPHPKTLDINQFNNQGDSEFVNIFFDPKRPRR